MISPPATVKQFLYAEHPPADALSDHVLAYWEFSVRLGPGESFLHHVWPDGCVSLVTASNGRSLVVANLIGPDIRAARVVVEGGWSYRGIRFWPDVGGALFGIQPAELRGKSLPLSELSGRGLELAEALAGQPDIAKAAASSDVCLMQRFTLPVIDCAVRDAVRLIAARNGEVSITWLASKVNVGIRQMQRRFRHATGLTPKEFARVRRMRSGLGAVLRGEKHWSRLAASLGYSDQAHLIRDFGEMTGFTPAALEDRLDRIEHDGVEP